MRYKEGETFKYTINEKLILTDEDGKVWRCVVDYYQYNSDHPYVVIYNDGDTYGAEERQLRLPTKLDKALA